MADNIYISKQTNVHTGTLTTSNVSNATILNSENILHKLPNNSAELAKSTTLQYYDEQGQVHEINVNSDALSALSLIQTADSTSLIDQANSVSDEQSVLVNNQHISAIGNTQNHSADATERYISCEKNLLAAGTEQPIGGAGNIRSEFKQNVLMPLQTSQISDVITSNASHTDPFNSQLNYGTSLRYSDEMIIVPISPAQVVASQVLSTSFNKPTFNYSSNSHQISSQGNDNSITAPLGSSENPIRLIQQGNQYTPVQQLSFEQLQQIMQVVQNQHQTKSNKQDTSVVYNPATNTRIIYRVVYPTDDKGKLSSGKSTQYMTVKQSLKKRSRSEESSLNCRISHDDKDQRKKSRPRTRSGRLSKPPRYMMNDYKHIHTLDWDEDYDDDDGGYSEIGYKEDDCPNVPSPEILPLKPRNWVCQTCKRSYIGEANLNRHWIRYPSHSHPDMCRNPIEENITTNEGGMLKNGKNNDDLQVFNRNITSSHLNLDLINLDKDNINKEIVSNIESYLDNSNKEKNCSSNEVVLSNENKIQAEVKANENLFDSDRTNKDMQSSTKLNFRKRGRRGISRGRGRPRIGMHPKHMDSYRDKPFKRKILLKQLADMCSDDELVDVLMPRILNAVSLWDYLLRKLENENVSKPDVSDVITEFSQLHKNIRELCTTSLYPITELDKQSSSYKTYEVDGSLISQSLGLHAGIYRVKNTQLSENQETTSSPITKDINGLNTPEIKQTGNNEDPTQISSSSPHDATAANECRLADIPSVDLTNSSLCSLNNQVLSVVNQSQNFVQSFSTVTPSAQQKSLSSENAAATVTTTPSVLCPASGHRVLSNFLNAPVTLPSTQESVPSAQSWPSCTSSPQLLNTYLTTSTKLLSVQESDQLSSPYNDFSLLKPPNDQQNLLLDNLSDQTSNNFLNHQTIVPESLTSTLSINSSMTTVPLTFSAPLTKFANSIESLAPTEVCLDSLTDPKVPQNLDDILSEVTIYQTEDGHLLIQRSDGITLQLEKDRSISLDVLQTLLAIDDHFQISD